MLQSQNKRKAPKKAKKQTNSTASIHAFTWKSISSSDIICFCTSGVTSKGITYERTPEIELQNDNVITAAWLAQLGECQSAGKTNTQGLQITENKVLPLLWHLQTVTLSTLVSQYFSLIWFLLDVKEPTPLFKKSKGVLKNRPWWCGQPFLSGVGYL